MLDDTVRMIDGMKRRGVALESRIYEDGLHAFHAFVWNENARQSWRDTYAFLDKHV